jgi:two-component system nitrogen regulation response regulator GlnG
MRTSALVVDDDDSIRFILSKALEGMGIDVTAVDDGSEVMPLVASRHFDLLVIDLYMPGMNGFEVLRQVRHADPTTLPRPRTRSDVPVLVVSGEVEAATVANAKRLGATAQLPKPVDIDAFESAVRGLVGGDRPSAAPTPGAAQRVSK